MKRRSFLAASLAATTMGSLNPALAADKEAFDPTSLEALRAGMPDPPHAMLGLAYCDTSPTRNPPLSSRRIENSNKQIQNTT